MDGPILLEDHVLGKNRREFHRGADGRGGQEQVNG